jgi:pimeloyl-ACP methyl ester carboxylesterase
MTILAPLTIRLQNLTLEVAHWPLAQATRPVHTFVFLHEGLGSVAMWRDWPDRLCQRLGCAGMAYSRQGYGQSDPIVDVRGPSGLTSGIRRGHHLPGYMHHEALHVLPALLKALDIERPVLLGHSDGGTIALIHASQFDVAACVVMAPHVMVETQSIQAIAAARSAYESGTLRQRLAPYHADVDSAFWPWNDVWLSPAFRDFDIRPELKSIQAPLLAIQGEDDPYGTLAQIDDIAKAVPQAQLLKLRHCGHSPHRDQTELVEKAVQTFMNGL